MLIESERILFYSAYASFISFLDFKRNWLWMHRHASMKTFHIFFPLSAFSVICDAHIFSLYEHTHQMLYLHDHKGITVLQKLLV